MTGAGELVSAFIAAIESKDLEQVIGMLTDDVVYDNVPMVAVTGHKGVRQALSAFLDSATAVEWAVSRQTESADGTTVWNERVDRFEIGGRWIEIPVAGVWEVRDGHIALWRDYFDLGTFQRQLEG